MHAKLYALDWNFGGPRRLQSQNDSSAFAEFASKIRARIRQRVVTVGKTWDPRTDQLYPPSVEKPNYGVLFVHA